MKRYALPFTTLFLAFVVAIAAALINDSYIHEINTHSGLVIVLTFTAIILLMLSMVLGLSIFDGKYREKE